MTTPTPWTEWETRAKRLTIDELRFVIADCRSAQRAMCGWNPEKEGFYSDQAATYAMELKRRVSK